MMDNTKEEVKTTVEAVEENAKTAEKLTAEEGTTTAETVQENSEKKAEAVTEVILQYRGYEVNMEDVTNRVKAHYTAKGFGEDSIESMQIYVKPEDFTAYFVINDSMAGKVNLF